ncbi:MAG: 2-succinyl-6-hydroxy-2,4-cyclohexadiene-1-carboxylate synthase [bacterium]|nr:2-succinyl-6-hydroxy-2,4-cyclohexadiene-1-carboxylate synthase [bacterium]
MSGVFVDADGVRLRAVIEGPESAPPVLILHGFTGSAESMACVAAPLAADYRVVRLELVGHGESDAPDDVAPYAMDVCTRQVASAASALGLERPHLVGYSMGGRTALATAVAFPGRFASVSLIGATAGIADEADRAARIAADEALADRIEDEGLEAFVDHWMALPIFASQSRLGPDFLARARAERLRQRPKGLANSLRGMGAGAQAPVWEGLEHVTAPVLLVAGGEDAKFRAIADALAAPMPDARIEIIEGVGHAAHLEDVNAFGDVLRAFLAEIETRREGERG